MPAAGVAHYRPVVGPVAAGRAAALRQAEVVLPGAGRVAVAAVPAVVVVVGS